MLVMFITGCTLPQRRDGTLGERPISSQGHFSRWLTALEDFQLTIVPATGGIIPLVWKGNLSFVVVVAVVVFNIYLLKRESARTCTHTQVGEVVVEREKQAPC